MTTELALDFAREVIGWLDAAPHHSGEYSIRQFARASGSRFYHSSLDDILPHVANWCDEQNTTLVMVYGKDDAAADWVVCIAGQEAANADPKIALMEACLKAERDRAQEHAVMP